MEYDGYERDDSDAVDITLELLRETEKAYGFRDAGGNMIFIPKSQVYEMENVKGNFYNMLIPEWLAEQKGLI